jgi:hypothetical protein
VISAALRRLTVLLAGSAAAVGAFSALLGLALGSSLSRSVSLGYYLVGSFLMVGGFFMGNRGPLRVKGETAGGFLFGSRVMRRATPEERMEAINNSAVFVFVGLVLIILGVVADSRFRLV